MASIVIYIVLAIIFIFLSFNLGMFDIRLCQDLVQFLSSGVEFNRFNVCAAIGVCIMIFILACIALILLWIGSTFAEEPFSKK